MCPYFGFRAPSDAFHVSDSGIIVRKQSREKDMRRIKKSDDPAAKLEVIAKVLTVLAVLIELINNLIKALKD